MNYKVKVTKKTVRKNPYNCRNGYWVDKDGIMHTENIWGIDTDKIPHGTICIEEKNQAYVPKPYWECPVCGYQDDMDSNCPNCDYPHMDFVLPEGFESLAEYLLSGVD